MDESSSLAKRDHPLRRAMEGMPALEGMMPQIPGGQPPPMPGGGMPAPGPVPSGGREQGTVSRWTERGFGFITPKDGGEDLFCHFSNIEDGNGLEPNSMVTYVKVYDERKGKERAEQVTGGITVERSFGGGGFGGGFGGGPGRGPCFDWQKGQCTRGAACRFSHDGEGGGGGFGFGGFGGGCAQSPLNHSIAIISLKARAHATTCFLLSL